MTIRTHLVILVTSSMVTAHARDEVQDRDEDSDSVGVSAEGHVAKSDVVVCGNMASGDPRQRCLSGVD